MARKRTQKKKQPARKRNGSSGGFLPSKMFFLKWIMILAVVTGAIGGIGYGVRYLLLNSRFFEIKEVVINSDAGYLLHGENRIKRLYAGQNIFTVDLSQVETTVKNSFQQVKRVEARRKMPDVLEINAVSRRPIAVIDSNGGIVVDKEGVVLAVGDKKRDLVEIRGIRFSRGAPSEGERINDGRLEKALVLIEGINEKMGEDRKKVEYVDVTEHGNILLGVSGTTVKMGSDSFSKKVDKLKEMVNDPNINMNDINYIDLRFEDAVISPK